VQNAYGWEIAWLFCVLLLLMVLGRAAFVFPLSFVHNWWAKDKLSFKEMIIIWWPFPPFTVILTKLHLLFVRERRNALLRSLVVIHQDYLM
jgi:hypothetical protein